MRNAGWGMGREARLPDIVVAAEGPGQWWGGRREVWVFDSGWSTRRGAGDGSRGAGGRGGESGGQEARGRDELGARSAEYGVPSTKWGEGEGESGRAGEEETRSAPGCDDESQMTNGGERLVACCWSELRSSPVEGCTMPRAELEDFAPDDTVKAARVANVRTSTATASVPRRCDRRAFGDHKARPSSQGAVFVAKE
jgi:hypothetical protein